MRKSNEQKLLDKIALINDPELSDLFKKTLKKKPKQKPKKTIIPEIPEIETKPKKTKQNNERVAAHAIPIKTGKRKNKFNPKDHEYSNIKEEFDKKVKFKVSKRRPKFSYTTLSCKQCGRQIKIHPSLAVGDVKCQSCIGAS